MQLATSLTGYAYLPKLENPDGTLWACGGGGGGGIAPNYNPSHVPRYVPSPPEPEDEEEEEEEVEDPSQIERERIDREIEDIEDSIKNAEESILEISDELVQKKKELVDLQKQRKQLIKDRKVLLASPVVWVPEGAMEWLLHEVGHYVASTPAERRLPNYGVTSAEFGHDGDREWQAWAFQEIVLAPWGPARHFAPPTQRDGAAFAKAGPMPQRALHHVDRRIAELGLDIERWRIVWGAWADWLRVTP